MWKKGARWRDADRQMRVFQSGVGINYSFNNKDSSYNSDSSSIGTAFSTNVGSKGTADGDRTDDVGKIRRAKRP
ncbi:hypothetical protein E2562_031565 [Oryza meyeriana var. granulata]|uniref:Uncharacterized protein n=1 Tax=Oryza meyeriana var. granulata TaxID=110450 RepID=A0A6G1CV87_9ORYZ|nr:hypothetical protein E2562_031565 [Oryza meyeriana var. granulata]